MDHQAPMPTYYYIASNEATRVMVEREDFDAIDQYVAHPKPFDGPLDCFDAPGFGESPPQSAPENAWVDGAYQIASRAVELGKESVLRHVGDKICFDYQRDGNSYDLFVLATEMHRFSLLAVLWDIADENGYRRVAAKQLNYAARRLMGYADVAGDEDKMLRLLKFYADHCESLWDVYHYSIAWNSPKITEWLIENYAARIRPEWTQLAVEVAESNKSKKSLAFVKNNAMMQTFLSAKPTEKTTAPDAACMLPPELSTFAKGPYQWGGWCCDKCGEMFPKGTERWFCRVCHSDVCVACHKADDA